MNRKTIAALTLAALVAVGCGGAPDDKPRTAAAPLPTTTSAAPKKADGTIGAGTWEVGTEVKPGTYTATARDHCYWARLKDFDGDITSSILANGNLDAGQRGRITVKDTDKGLELSGDCRWSVAAAAKKK
jgi:hypothetical protein